MNVSFAHESLLGQGTAAVTPSAARFPSTQPARSKGELDHITPVDTFEPWTSEQLAERAKAGSLDAFEQLVRCHQSRIYNFFRHFSVNHQDAEDLTQDTFIKAHRYLSRYDVSFPFLAWLFTIARRTGASHFRSAARFEELPKTEEAIQETPATALERKDEHSSLWRLVRMLKPKQAQVLWLRYAEGFSVAETARIMRTNQIHIKVLLHRARSNLVKMLAARELWSALISGRPELSAKGPDSETNQVVL